MVGADEVHCLYRKGMRKRTEDVGRRVGSESIVSPFEKTQGTDKTRGFGGCQRELVPTNTKSSLYTVKTPKINSITPPVMTVDDPSPILTNL